MLPPRIGDYYHLALRHLRAEVDGTPDDRAFELDTKEWAEYLVAKHRIEPVKRI